MAELDPTTQTFASGGTARSVTPLRLFSPGTQLANRYEVRRVIDWGGFAVVYVAYDRELHRDIALKVLRPDRVSDAALTRFRREVAVARDASSPRLVRVFDIETSDGAIYLTMELVDGGSLRNRLRESQLSIEEVIRIGAGIAEGLQALHALGIVHRDIKPANVLLDSAGEVKLADFGLARHLESDSTHATTTGAIVGTLAYLSPEQALGQPVDHRSDLYALGVVLFEMLTGTVPFEGESPLGTLLARMKASADDVRRLRKDCPRWLAALVARLLERKAEDRYPSAEAVLADLHRRRSALAPRRVVRFAAFGVLALALLAAAFAGWRAWQHRNAFSHMVAANGAIAGVSRSGRTLWQLGDFDEQTALRYALLEHGHDGVREIAVVLRKPGDVSMSTVNTLSFLDPQTGRVKRRVRLPDVAHTFRFLPARYALGSMTAIDLDGDGGEEVVASFIQLPEWPSYTTLYEPRIGRARVVFAATGHHHLSGAEDIDGDGHTDLILQGIHNGWGWYNALAAVRPVPAVNAFDAPENVFTTPDITDVYNNAGLLWYAYLPRGEQSAGMRATRHGNELHVTYPDKRRVVLGLDGLPIGVDRRRERAAARQRAHDAMNRAVRLTAVASYDAALEANDLARGEAERAGDSLLAEAARIRRGRILVRAGRFDEAQAYYEQISRGAFSAADIALEAAEQFHLQGKLVEALAWYRRALALVRPHGLGRSHHEFIEGYVLAAAELGRFDDGIREAERFLETWSAQDRRSYYREFVRWRAGQIPERDEEWPIEGSVDLIHYWALEFAYARGAAPESLLPRFPADLEARSPTRSAMLSLHAELLHRLGQRDEARRVIATALQRGEADRMLDTMVRAHLPLVRERHARIMKD